MSFDVKIIADSQGRYSRITTMQLRYPRFIHAEFMTHRVFSRNASSSRAIPTAKLIEQARTDPACPIHWGKNQPGMQANEELTGEALLHAKEMWHAAANRAADNAETLAMIGAHKQIVNRIIEPFLHISVVVTSTEWENFFALRCHKDAQPEIRRLAEWMREALRRSIPRKLKPGQWHTPYVAEGECIALEDALVRSVARCARVSYEKHEGGQSTFEEDFKLFTRLVGATPRHSSPAEHQAMCNLIDETDRWHIEGMSGNFSPAWVQYRKLLEAERNPEAITYSTVNYQP